MRIEFILLCLGVVAIATVVVMQLAPILWDAAGAIEVSLNTIYHIDITTR